MRVAVATVRPRAVPAGLFLGWRPRYDQGKTTEAAFSHQRASDNPGTVWYPG